MQYDLGRIVLEIHTQQFCQVPEYGPRIVVFHHDSNKTHVHNVKKPQEPRGGFFEDVPGVHMDISLEPGPGADLV